DGERVDEVEALVLEDERRCERVRLEAAERQVRAAPVDRRRADVAAGDRAVEVAPPAGDAAAAAAEVEDGPELVERHVRGDRVVPRAPAAEEPVGVARAGDAHHEAARRQRRSVDREAPRGAEGDESLVRAERRTDEPEALKQVENA